MNTTIYLNMYTNSPGDSGHTFLKAFAFLRYCTIEKYN